MLTGCSLTALACPLARDEAVGCLNLDDLLVGGLMVVGLDELEVCFGILLVAVRDLVLRAGGLLGMMMLLACRC